MRNGEKAYVLIVIQDLIPKLKNEKCFEIPNNISQIINNFQFPNIQLEMISPIIRSPIYQDMSYKKDLL